MTKTFLIAGSNWVSEVELDTEHLTLEQIKLEAATRAVEQHFGKRDDIPYQRHEPITLTEEDRKKDELHACLVDLLTEELEKGCGIGMLLCIMDNRDPNTIPKNEDSEWYISSKLILENVGIPSLVKRFDEKYPVGSKNS
jgi:hypothetical protein